MKLKELVFNNFMPYKGEQIIQFPQHETQNVMLIYGDNMRGKTSLLNAIRWGFYGTAVGRHMRSIPRLNLVNMNAAKEGDWSVSVTIRFSEEGKQYELNRRIQKKNHISAPRNDADFEETIWLRINSEMIDGHLIANVVNQIAPEDISRFFLFDGELLQEYENLLINNNEQGEEIKKHIEQALGVPALINGLEDINHILKNARALQTKDAKNDDSNKQLGERQRILSIHLNSLEKDLDANKAQHMELQQQIDDIDDELKNTEAVQKKKVKIEGLMSDKKSVENQLFEQANIKRDLLKTAWKDVLHESVEPILIKLKSNRDYLQNAISRKAVLESKIKDLLFALDNPLCPTCKQTVPNDNLQSIRESIANFQAESELLVVKMEDISDHNSKIDKLSKIKSAQEGRRIIASENKTIRLQVDNVRIETELDELLDEIKDEDTDQITRQREKRDRLVGLVSRLSQSIEKCKSEIIKNNSEQDHIATIIAKSVGARGQLSSIRVKLCQDLESIFAKGIDKLRDNLREDVEEYATAAFKELTTEKTYAGLEINGNYGLSILDVDGGIIKERSAGAEQVVALALIDGLSRTARNAGPIIMDTPFGRLDPKHRDNVLKYLPNMAQQVVLLVHEGEIDPLKDMQNFASRLGEKYRIERISATESRIVRSN